MQFRGGGVTLGGAVGSTRTKSSMLFPFYKSVHVEIQALNFVFIQNLVVNGNQKLVILTMKKNIFFGKGVLIQIPVQHRMNFSTGRSGLKMPGMPPMIVSEGPVFRIITDMAGMDDDQVLSMLRMRTVAVGGHYTPDPSMIKRKGSKMFGNENAGIPLVLI
jgi:hypothetical protein